MRNGGVRIKAMEQLELYEEQRITVESHTKQSKWERAFQKWCDEKSQEYATDLGKCGYGVFCDCCDGCYNGKPCVRSLNAYARERGLRIDYENADFADIWRGNNG